MGSPLVRSAVVSAWMISRTTSVQPPQQAPAPQAEATSRAVAAPLRTALRMVRSETPLQWHTSIVVLFYLRYSVESIDG